MAKRKLNTKRLYKLVKILVITISVISLLLTVIVIKNDDPLFLTNCLKDCDKHWTPAETELERNMLSQCTGICFDTKEYSERLLIIYLSVGLGLPILFFGGTWLFNYLFPKQKDKKEVSSK